MLDILNEGEKKSFTSQYWLGGQCLLNLCAKEQNSNFVNFPP